MKTFIYSLLILIPAILLSGCSNSSNSRSTDGESANIPAPADSERALQPDSATLAASRLPAKEKGIPKVLEFSATWCGPCQEMKPIFEAAEKSYEGKIEMQSIDVDEHPELAEKYNIHSIPAFICFDAYGNIAERRQGYMSAEELDNLLNSLLSD